MKKVFLGMALAISVSMAEKSDAFLGGGFQYSNLENQNTTLTPDANNNTPIDTSMFGNNQPAPAQETQSASKPDTKVNPSASWMKNKGTSHEKVIQKIRLCFFSDQ
ncbi:membrane protein [Helicobacter pylori]